MTAIPLAPGFAAQAVSLRTPASSSGRNPRHRRALRAPEGVWRRRPGAPPKWTSQDSMGRSCTGSRLGSPDPERSARLHEAPCSDEHDGRAGITSETVTKTTASRSSVDRAGGRGRRPPSSLASQGHRALPPGVTETKNNKQVDSPSSGLCSTIASDTRSRGLRPRASRCSRGFLLSRATTTQAPTLLPPPPGGLPSEEVQPGLVGRRNIPHAVMSDRAGGHDSELPSSLASPRRPLPEGSALCGVPVRASSIRRSPTPTRPPRRPSPKAPLFAASLSARHRPEDLRRRQGRLTDCRAFHLPGYDRLVSDPIEPS